MIGERIKQARLSLGYSAEQVAAFLNVSPATVYRYENGDISKLPSKFIKPLAEFLSVSPAYLMGWEESESDTFHSVIVPNNKLFTKIMEAMTPDEYRAVISSFESAYNRLKAKGEIE
jgi:transcriptional regulator with XRE-family HTH domain